MCFEKVGSSFPNHAVCCHCNMINNSDSDALWKQDMPGKETEKWDARSPLARMKKAPYIIIYRRNTFSTTPSRYFHLHKQPTSLPALASPAISRAQYGRTCYSAHTAVPTQQPLSGAAHIHSHRAATQCGQGGATNGDTRSEGAKQPAMAGGGFCAGSHLVLRWLGDDIDSQHAAGAAR